MLTSRSRPLPAGGDSRRATEATALAVLGDMLVFLRRIALSDKVRLQLCSARWTGLLLQVTSNRDAAGTSNITRCTR